MPAFVERHHRTPARTAGTEMTSARILLLLALVLVVGRTAHADPDPGSQNIPPELLDVGVDEHLDAQVPLDTIFKDETGKVVRFGDYVDGKRPILLVLAYHTCATLCPFVQNGALDGLKGTTWTIGREFQVVTLSISPKDTPAIAAQKKKEMLASYGRDSDLASSGWHFLVGDDQNAHRVADAVGWKYHLDSQGEYAHPTAIMLLKPNGRVARYLYGIEFPASDVRIGLLEASEGKSISTVERILLYCYHYDPRDRKYSLLATHVMQIGGGLTLLLLGVFVGGMWLRERRRRESSPTPREAFV
jgi:protein SCO1